MNDQTHNICYLVAIQICNIKINVNSNVCIPTVHYHIALIDWKFEMMQSDWLKIVCMSSRISLAYLKFCQKSYYGKTKIADNCFK